MVTSGSAAYAVAAPVLEAMSGTVYRLGERAGLGSEVKVINQLLAGDRASKTLTLHRRIYAADPTARFVIHTHSTHLVALTPGRCVEPGRCASAAHALLRDEGRARSAHPATTGPAIRVWPTW